MRWLLRKCIKCNRYTLSQERCPYCGGQLKVPHPPKYSPNDKYIEYRYKLKYKTTN
ncbi:putative Zn-ribbon RNA-binding protein [Caldisphaera lagunensis DSM 15908]|uniref:Ribosome biogenesis protein Nop10 n=1 Tax=Caldisphaera lagunensis (strain DSM 15908 / JCM 11604 / ANMR 0165 / IC-154) TaxID=1056495 RepID=L0AAM0_CALLD|nr:RNA-protein complex protein Nop10 [Caldisphaera lagunensis]AFZ70147.1 putative Zn-ribbon RNA-binding protein [Caldisphaera lagunensis DSM 15908]